MPCDRHSVGRGDAPVSPRLKARRAPSVVALGGAVRTGPDDGDVRRAWMRGAGAGGREGDEDVLGHLAHDGGGGGGGRTEAVDGADPVDGPGREDSRPA